MRRGFENSHHSTSWNRARDGEWNRGGRGRQMVRRRRDGGRVDREGNLTPNHFFRGRYDGLDTVGIVTKSVADSQLVTTHSTHFGQTRSQYAGCTHGNVLARVLLYLSLSDGIRTADSGPSVSHNY